jgi:tellurite resistance protein
MPVQPDSDLVLHAKADFVADLQSDDDALETSSDDRDYEAVLAVLETGYLSMLSDGEIDNEELSILKETCADWLSEELGEETLAEIFEGFADSIRDESATDRLNTLSKVLYTQEWRNEAFDLACRIACANGEVADSELALLIRMAGTYGLTEQQAQQRFQHVADEFSAEVTDDESEEDELLAYGLGVLLDVPARKLLDKSAYEHVAKAVAEVQELLRSTVVQNAAWHSMLEDYPVSELQLSSSAPSEDSGKDSDETFEYGTRMFFEVPVSILSETNAKQALSHALGVFVSLAVEGLEGQESVHQVCTQLGLSKPRLRVFAPELS